MVLTTLVAAVVLGIAAQVVAERSQLPAILPLLVAQGNALELLQPLAERVGATVNDVIEVAVEEP